MITLDFLIDPQEFYHDDLKNIKSVPDANMTITCFFVSIRFCINGKDLFYDKHSSPPYYGINVPVEFLKEI